MDYSRKKQCDDSQGGISKVYIMPFIDYLDSEITIVNNVLTVFPYNIIYDMNAVNISSNIDANDDLYDEKASFQLKKLLENDNFKPFISQDYRLIIKTNNGKIRLLGLRNGMVGSYKEEIGANRTDFNGYSFNFQNKEEQTAPYLKDLSFFAIMPIDGLLLQDGNNNTIQDSNNNIITN